MCVYQSTIGRTVTLTMHRRHRRMMVAQFYTVEGFGRTIRFSRCREVPSREWIRVFFGLGENKPAWWNHEDRTTMTAVHRHQAADQLIRKPFGRPVSVNVQKPHTQTIT